VLQTVAPGTIFGVPVRNRVFGTLAVLWGAFIVVNYAIGGGGEGNEVYETGQFVGMVLGAALLVIGVRMLIKGRR